MGIDMDLMTQTRRAAFEAAYNADDMWTEELLHVYGRDATKARYDVKRNAATPMLKALRDIKMNADATWQMLSKVARNELVA